MKGIKIYFFNNFYIFKFFFLEYLALLQFITKICPFSTVVFSNVISVLILESLSSITEVLTSLQAVLVNLQSSYLISLFKHINNFQENSKLNIM